MLAPSFTTNHNLVDFKIRFLTRSQPAFWKLSKNRSSHPRRYGRGPVEVMVVAGIGAFALMIVLVALPKGRESARMATCQKNLMQIGVGLQMYQQAQGHYPTVPNRNGTTGDSPILALFNAFVVPDLLEMKDPSNAPKPSRTPPRGTRVPGLTCPSDSNAFGGPTFPYISYRANTGDSSAGVGGPFQPGRTFTSGEIERADGLSFTAAYAERLVGDRRDGSPASCDYATSPGPIVEAKCPECSLNRWRGDAGSDWAESSWKSTLYNHVLTPNALRSCIADDDRSALMGASSSHVDRINVLMMDGSLKGVTPTIAPKVWQALGTVGTAQEKPGP
jgi:type II secretory pathway pseudopilin PulG